MLDYVSLRVTARSFVVPGALAVLLLVNLASPSVAGADPPRVYVPATGDFDAYGVPFTTPAPGRDAIVPPRADPEHLNPGVNEFYPATSRRLGEQGTVTLLLTVDVTGRVSQAKVETSSGYGRLDDAAQKAAVRSWHFLPGRINGTPATMQMPIKVTFR